MVHAFFDDSNTYAKNGLLCLAGYIADDQGWDAFGQKWQRALAHTGIQRLHTSDFLAGEAEYRALGLDREAREDAVRRFIGVIGECGLIAVAVALDGRAFKEEIQAEKKRPNPQHFCFERVLSLTRDSARGWLGDKPFMLAFDDSEEHSMRFYGALRDLKKRKRDLRESVIGIAFADDRFVMPLQAADLLACLSVREARRGAEAWVDSPFADIIGFADAVGPLVTSEHWDAQEIKARRAEIMEASRNAR